MCAEETIEHVDQVWNWTEILKSCRVEIVRDVFSDILYLFIRWRSKEVLFKIVEARLFLSIVRIYQTAVTIAKIIHCERRFRE